MAVGWRQTFILSTNGGLAGRKKIQGHLRQEIFSTTSGVGAIDLRVPDAAVRNRNQRR
jgi:hypothetical protein